MDKLYVVIPAYNESENIEKTVDLQKQEFGPYEIKTFFLKK